MLYSLMFHHDCYCLFYRTELLVGYTLLMDGRLEGTLVEVDLQEIRVVGEATGLGMGTS